MGTIKPLSSQDQDFMWVGVECDGIDSVHIIRWLESPSDTIDSTRYEYDRALRGRVASNIIRTHIGFEVPEAAVTLELIERSDIAMPIDVNFLDTTVTEMRRSMTSRMEVIDHGIKSVNFEASTCDIIWSRLATRVGTEPECAFIVDGGFISDVDVSDRNGDQDIHVIIFRSNLDGSSTPSFSETLWATAIQNHLDSTVGLSMSGCRVNIVFR